MNNYILVYYIINIAVIIYTQEPVSKILIIIIWNLLYEIGSYLLLKKVHISLTRRHI